ncbi:MAG: amidophosphoribosyltransferase [Nanoarchaeota archaeon]|mgnify:CR=1 FL=1
MDELNEKCGVIGIFGKGLDVSRLSFYGLFALQHRGQESSGIAVSNGWKIDCFKNVGLVTQAYSESDISSLKGHISVGHNRYSTFGGTGINHASPIISRDGRLALSHNGNLPSVMALQSFLSSKDIDVSSRNDSQMMTDAVGYFMEQGRSIGEAVMEAYPLFTGAFSVVAMSKDTLVAFKDHCGIRPLALGKIDGGYVVASETCAFNTIGAEFIREVRPGEMIIINSSGVRCVQLADPDQKFDVFEFVYFSRPDSIILGRPVYDVRRKFGEILAVESPLNVDIIIPVPETAIPVAVGYSAISGIPLEMALVKNRYIHRTFIEPDSRSRQLGVKLKLNPLTSIIKGKRVAVVDDSIVRGTTSAQIVKALFDAGAVEVHFLVSSPPVRFPDFYGIDTPKKDQLVASSKSVEEIRQFLGATSLNYLSIEGLVKGVGLPREKLSLSCFDGVYPIDLLERSKEV